MKGNTGAAAPAAGKRAGRLCRGLAWGLLALGACGNFNLPIKETLDYNLSLTPVRSLDELRAAVSGPGKGGVAALMDNLVVGEPLVIAGRAVTLTAYGGSAAVLSRGEGFDGAFFVVENGGALTLGAAESGPLTLDGGGDRGLAAESALIRVKAGGVLTLNASTALQNNHNANAAGLGGGLFIEGTCIIQGGAVRDNRSGYAGGGIVVDAGGILVMERGELENNYAPHGGGMAIRNGTFVMREGSIAGNRSGNGGGALVYTGGRFDMYGGTIAGNFADDEAEIINNRVGGGVCVFGGEFTLWNGTISGNEALGGGGVFVKEDEDHIRASFVMKNGLIGDNTAKQVAGDGGSGGGVEVFLADFTMENGSITGNTAEYVGGGVTAASGAVFTMRDGVIGDNRADNSGGGVYLYGTSDSASFIMENGFIGGNHAATTAGGVYVYEGAEFVMENGLIGGNTVDTAYGNGMYIYGNAATIFRMSGGARVAATDEVYLRTAYSALTLGGDFTADPAVIARIKLDPSTLSAGRTVLKQDAAGLIAAYKHRFPLLNVTTLTVGDDGKLQSPP